MKEIKEIINAHTEITEITESAFGTGCAQMSEANISAISFISAGLQKNNSIEIIISL